MMKKIMISVLLGVFAWTLAACSGEQADSSSAPAASSSSSAPAPSASAPAEMAEEAMESASETMDSASREYGQAIDHAADEMEFQIKRSLAGVESLLSDYAENGFDTGDLEAQKADLEAKLAKM